MKFKIVEQLGQSDILLPSLIAAGLSANNRVKVRLSLLQAAAAHARDPSGKYFELADECRAVELDPIAMEALVNRASGATDDRLTAPGLAGLGEAIWNDVGEMVHAVKAGDTALGDASLTRLSLLRASSWAKPSDSVELEYSQIARMTEISGEGGDSLHRLVMDLHKALNRLSAVHAEEVLAGAHVFGLLPTDRPAVEVFMQGLDSTRKLKFDHPGLATMAIRSGERLTIQNDIGETDAHVVVITVEDEAVTITHTDVHLARVKFLTRKVSDLLDENGVALIHTIGRADGPGAANARINKYIFLGGYVPALSKMMPAIERAGLYVTDIDPEGMATTLHREPRACC